MEWRPETDLLDQAVAVGVAANQNDLVGERRFPGGVLWLWSATRTSWRGSGGPYNLLKGGVSTTAYTDSNVQSGSTYYYVTTAVDASGVQSVYSDEAQAVIPMP